MAITNDPSRGIMFYDNCEDVPPSSDWGAGQFNSKYIAFTGGNQDFNNPDPRAGIYLSSAYARKGTKSYKLQLQKRTDKYGTCCEWVRSEVAWMAPGDLIPANEWKFAAVSTLIDPVVNLAAGIKYQIAFDSKESPDDQQTPFWVGIKAGRYIAAGRWVGDDADLNMPVVKGVWVDWLWQRSSTLLRLYANAQLVWEKSGSFTGPNPFPRQQHGIYKWAWQDFDNQGEGGYNPPADDQPIVMYIDEVKFGTPSADINDFFLTTPPPDPQPPDPGPDPIPTPIGTIKINSGGKKSGDWIDDAYFSGGTPYSVASAPVADQYKTERFGNHSYSIPVKNGTYDVKLHFAEVWHSAAGARVFDVFINDINTTTPVLNDFDIFVAAGGKNKPIVKVFRTTVKDANISIKFVTVKDQAKISAIEIVPVTVVDESMYVKSVALRDEIVDGVTRKVSVTTFNDNTEQIIKKKSTIK